MCLGKVAVTRGGDAVADIADVIHVAIEGDGILLRTLFGETHEFRPARLAGIDFRNSILSVVEEEGI